MELTELKNILAVCDKKISESVHINRKALKILLTDSSKKRINKEKARALLYVLSPFILCGIIAISDIQFHYNINFYIGVSLFVTIYSALYLFDVKYYISLCRIDFSEPVLFIKKQIKELERLKIKMNRIRYICMPVAIFSILLILLPEVAFTSEFIIMLILIGMVFVGSLYYTRHSIQKRYNALNKEIEELESLEK